MYTTKDSITYPSQREAGRQATPQFQKIDDTTSHIMMSRVNQGLSANHNIPEIFIDERFHQPHHCCYVCVCVVPFLLGATLLLGGR